MLGSWVVLGCRGSNDGCRSPNRGLAGDGRMGGLGSEDLAQAFVEGEFDPGLTGDADAAAFGVDLPQESEGQVDVDALFGGVIAGEMG